MPKLDGYKTKEKILQVAEELFSEKGFDATSVDKIAKTAEVNKALIYYYFKNKGDIIVSLFTNIVKEFVEHVESSLEAPERKNRVFSIEEKIKEEITFLGKRKKILSVMLMESLKINDKDNFLFQCAEIVMNQEVKGLMKKIAKQKREKPWDKQPHFVYEFFTGFIPIVTFVILQDKWCEYFKCKPEQLLEYFIDSFQRAHLASHLKAPWRRDSNSERR